MRRLSLEVPPPARQSWSISRFLIDRRSGRRTVMVSISKLRGVQSYLETSRVRQYIQHPPEKPINILKIARQFVLIDGYHRVCAAINRGETTIAARIYRCRPSEYRKMLRNMRENRRFSERYL